MSMEPDQVLPKIPAFVFWTGSQLINAGFEAHIVGGCVRDLLLDRAPKDWDIATNATPEQIIQLFPKSITTHARFGTIIVISPDEHGETHQVEVTTYRKETEYVSGRWPSHIEFGQTLQDDLARRDFTVNAMAVSLAVQGQKAFQNEAFLIDLFDGQSDLNKKVIRAVGKPVERFEEDGLRGYRACRLASVLEFEIEKQTFLAIGQTLNIARQVSMERVRDEFMRLLLHSVKPSYGIELLHESGLLALFLPELEEGIDIYQPKYHVYDVYQHSLNTLDISQDQVKLAGLLHDIGKPRTLTKDENGDIHFFDHAKVGAQMTRDIMERLKFPKSEINRVAHLVENHMFYYTEEWTEAAVRRFIHRVGESTVDDLFALRIADSASNPKSQFDPKDIQKLEARIAQLRQKDMALKVTDLALDGHDLQALGLKGPQVGDMLQKLLEAVIDDPELNNKQTLLVLAQKSLKTNHSSV